MECGFTSASLRLWDLLDPLQRELGTWEPTEVGLGGAGARVGKGKEFGKGAGAGNARLREGPTGAAGEGLLS